MNKHDSERLSGLLKSKGHVETADEESELIVFNTCSVRENAVNRLRGHLGQLKPRKKENEELLVAVGGCFAQSERDRLLKDFPQVDIVFGTHNLGELPDLIQKTRQLKKGICSIKEEKEGFISDLPSSRKSRFSAWVTITEGCDNFCSYCIVPYVRGRERSREVASILDEVRELASQGVVEVTLLGQNVNSFKSPDGKNFADLLRFVNQIDDVRRIRFATSHPRDLSNDIIDSIAQSEKVCEHIHLPVQAGSNAILRAMNRGYNRDYYINLVSKVRDKIADVSITTDIIVGFPGETPEDFEDTIDLVQKVDFDAAFTFIYSPRKDTAASKLLDQADKNEKSSRFSRLVELQETLNLNKNLRLIGSKHQVLVEGRSKKAETLCGRSRANRVVNFPASDDLIGKFVDVEIISAGPNSLNGKLMKQSRA